jgi:two-component system response regulator YesN
LTEEKEKANYDEEQDPLISLTESFFREINLNPRILLFDENQSPAPDALFDDRGLRRSLGVSDSSIAMTFPDVSYLLSQSQAIFTAEDLFGCRYIAVRLKDKDVKAQFLTAGPYRIAPTDAKLTAALCRKLGLQHGADSYLQQYYSTLPMIHDSFLLDDFLFSLGHSLYRDPLFHPRNLTMQSVTLKTEKDVKAFISEGIQINPDPDVARNLEDRYEAENRFMQAIARGDRKSALDIFQHPAYNFEVRRSVSALRNEKNYLIIANTLCRKAAESAQVHPSFLDAVSGIIAIQIENALSENDLIQVRNSMVREYCLLVSRQTTKAYSRNIAKATNYITIHLTEPLSLSVLADVLGISKSYLAAQFKKETGQTMSDYISRARIEYAASILKGGKTSVQDAADACGIPNLCWFERLFRRYKGMTPAEYKKHSGE